MTLKIPDNKYFISNNHPSIAADGILTSADYRHSLWVINQIEDVINGRPFGKPIQSICLGDLIEYVDKELSFNDRGDYLGSVIGKVCEIKEKEVLLIKPNKERYLMGNNSQFVNFTPYHYYTQSNSTSRSTRLRMISTSAIIIFLLISFLLFVGWILL